MPRFVVVAEKRSVAEAIYKVLRKYGLKEVTVTSVSGHLMDCDLVERYDRWRLSDLLELLRPENTRLVVSDKYAYSRVGRVLSNLREGLMVVATDNDHEGELIGYELVILYRNIRGHTAEFRRMRFNSLEEDEIIRKIKLK